MPVLDSIYTSDDAIMGLYLDPQNEILLAEYILQTAGVQMGFQLAGAGGFGGSSTGGIPDPGVTGGGGPCFTGEHVVTLFSGVEIGFAELFKDRGIYIGKGARSFTANNLIVPGEIRDVFKNTVYEILEVGFKGEDRLTRCVKTHRFWTPRMKYRQIRSFHRGWRVSGYDGDWKWVRVASKKLVAYPEGIDVYNLLIGRYHNYLVAAPGMLPKAVSNTKPIE